MYLLPFCFHYFNASKILNLELTEAVCLKVRLLLHSTLRPVYTERERDHQHGRERGSRI